MPRKKFDPDKHTATRQAFQFLQNWELRNMLAQLFMPMAFARRRSLLADLNRQLAEIAEREQELQARLAELEQGATDTVA
jgi:hypothetical protein